MLDKAVKLAKTAHSGQVDKGGEDYIYHPLRVMGEVDSIEEKIVGVLHDVLEDTYITLKDLIKEEFSDEVIEALKYLTRTKEETYLEYIRKIKINPIARVVKIADIKDNMDLTRLPQISDIDLSRNKRYEKALGILEGGGTHKNRLC